MSDSQQQEILRLEGELEAVKTQVSVMTLDRDDCLKGWIESRKAANKELDVSDPSAKLVLRLEAELAKSREAVKVAQADAEYARGDRDGVLKTIAAMTPVAEKANEVLRDQGAEIERLKAGIRKAFKWSGNRWSEWGSRAESVAEILDAALEGREEDKELVPS